MIMNSSYSSEKTGCFSAFSFRNLLPQRNKSSKVQATDAVNMNMDYKLGHGDLCAGGDWLLTPSSPPSYSAPPQYVLNIARDYTVDPAVVETIESKLNELDAQLRELSLNIHSHPEVCFQEEYAHDALTAFLDKHSFKVTRHYAGLKTAWRAEYCVGNGGRVLGINSEMDALPGIGHACGHNLIAISGVGVAVAVKTALVAHGIPGKIVILGTPAEERGGGKILLLERGAYKEMDVCIMSHPSPGEPHSTGDGSSTAAQTMYVEYTGKTAHAAASPWEGINAQDAAVSAYNSISSLRQQLKPDLRVHGIIEGTNWTPNVIPDNAKLTYIARASNKKDLVDLVERVRRCFYAAAFATGCGVNVEMNHAYLDLRQNPVLARDYGKVAIEHCGMTFDHLGTSASTDFGNVTYELPSLHPRYAIPCEPNGGNHTPLFTRAAQTKEAHIATMKVTKGLALTGFRVLSDSFFYEEVKAAFEVDKEARAHSRPDNGASFEQ